MAEKKRSAITKVTLNTATFEGETFEPTYINLFFGRNGAGKSSVAYAIEDGSGVKWKAGESPENYDLLIYNQDFIDENFESFDNLQGVFTVDKVNIQIQQKIDTLGTEKIQVADEMAKLIEAGNKKKAVKDSLLTQLQNECWSRSSDIRADFDATQGGRKRKNTFTEKILATTPAEHDLDELKELYDVAYDANSQAYGLFKKSADAFGRYDLSGADLMGRSIISSSDTTFAAFMRTLGATDWVKNGHAHYVKNSDGKCPFCQQKLPENFENDIASCFDEQYQNDQSALAEFQSAYKGWTQSILDVFEENLTNVFPKLDIELYKEKVTHLQTVITANLRQIEKKIDKPALEVELDDVKPLIMEIDTMIDGFNKQIAANNTVVNSKKTKKKECEDALWEYLAKMFEKEVKDYRDGLKTAEDELTKLGTEYKTKKARAVQIQTEISQLRSQTINTSEAIDNINKLLKDSGFQGFSLQEKKDQQDIYEVIRENGEVAQKLSEGEKNFIAFLYFYQLVKGSGRAGSAAIITTDGQQQTMQNVADSRDKIVVIDDPVSSMDSNTLFIVSALVHEMIEVCNNNVNYAERIMDGTYIKQIFILTHNAYFHREISYNQVARYESVSFFMIRKSDNISEIEECINKPKSKLEDPTNRNPVQNSYAALWEEYMALNSTIPLLNVIRRILDYYFIQLCGYKENNVRKTILEEKKDEFVEEDENGHKDYTKLHLATAMLSYIGCAEGFVDRFNLVEDCNDAEQYKKVLEMIFDKLGQKQHYDMMTIKKRD